MKLQDCGFCIFDLQIPGSKQSFSCSLFLFYSCRNLYASLKTVHQLRWWHRWQISDESVNVYKQCVQGFVTFASTSSESNISIIDISGTDDIHDRRRIEQKRSKVSKANHSEMSYQPSTQIEHSADLWVDIYNPRILLERIILLLCRVGLRSGDANMDNRFRPSDLMSTPPQQHQIAFVLSKTHCSI